jgi:hypothetical protein
MGWSYSIMKGHNKGSNADNGRYQGAGTDGRTVTTSRRLETHNPNCMEWKFQRNVNTPERCTRKSGNCIPSRIIVEGEKEKIFKKEKPKRNGTALL